MGEATVLNHDDKGDLTVEDTEMGITIRAEEGKLRLQFQHRPIKRCCLKNTSSSFSELLSSGFEASNQNTQNILQAEHCCLSMFKNDLVKQGGVWRGHHGQLKASCIQKECTWLVCSAQQKRSGGKTYERAYKGKSQQGGQGDRRTNGNS